MARRLRSASNRILLNIVMGIEKMAKTFLPVWPAIFIVGIIHGLVWWQALVTATPAYIGMAIGGGIVYVLTSSTVRALRGSQLFRGWSKKSNGK
jgi:hypothetical protein